MCELCDNEYLVRGAYYKIRFSNIPVCANCKTIHDGSLFDATYVGLIDGNHIFRRHKSFVCPGCHKRMFYAYQECGNRDGFSLVQELFAGIPVEIL